MAYGLKEGFRKYLEEAIGYENAAVAFSALDGPASVSVRLNPWKGQSVPLQDAAPVPWSCYGRSLDSRPAFTLDPFFHAGAYYVQDSSSMFAGHVFRSLMPRVTSGTDRPLRVLDLCAAPGGKTTDLAASLREVCGSGFVLVSNEVVSQRASTLALNVALWGDPCVVVTSEDPAVLASMCGWFDVIIADVPCSGEGMFRKDVQARKQWSEDAVKLCQARQRRIAADVWPALAEGGMFIYSTCTFNRYENDDNVRWISENLGADIISSEVFSGDAVPHGVLETANGFSLVPGLVEGEGQYCAVLLKTSAARGGTGKYPKGGYAPLCGREASGMAGYFTDEVDLVLRNGLVKAVPKAVSSEVYAIGSRLHVLSSGCAAGEIKKGTLVPDPDLALSLIFRRDTYPRVDLDLKGALSYLHGDQPVLKEYPAGYLTVCYGKLPLGFVKNLGNRCNSLFPRGRRIRMDIDRKCAPAAEDAFPAVESGK